MKRKNFVAVLFVSLVFSSLFVSVFSTFADPPEHGTPTLTSYTGGYTQVDDYICQNVSTYDPDGDPVRNIFNWVRNGETITKLALLFDYNSATNVYDRSGYDNDGTVSGATWTSDGYRNGAYSFDGNDVITIPDDPSLGGDGTWEEMTLEFWVKPSALQRGSRMIGKKIDTASSGSYMCGFQTSTSDPYNTFFFGVTVDGRFVEIWDWH